MEREVSLVPKPARAYEVGACCDLGVFDRDAPDRGVEAYLARAHRTLDWLVLMEDRRPEFFLTYRPGRDDAEVPLNRHGPHEHAWTVADVRDLVRHLHAHGVRVLLGAWMHENAWVDERHPELLMRGPDGRLWQDTILKCADLNPLKRLRADPDHDVPEGMPFAEYVARQYRALRADLGLDGFFVGDGGMGFREFGSDDRDALYYDFDTAFVAEFLAEAKPRHHDGCELREATGMGPGIGSRRAAADVRAHHADEWVAWVQTRWAAFYRSLAEAVHERNGAILAAYNAMNYDPVLAREHGVDYRQIAEAGLDVLVFQTYDWAWGPHTTLTRVGNKDEATNLVSLLLTRAHVGHDTKMRVVFTTETSDAVERWASPLENTLRQVRTYGGARSLDGEDWRPAVDGTFVVWSNHVPSEHWRELAAAWDDAMATRRAPERSVVVVDHDFVLDPHTPGSYEHVQATLKATPSLPDGVVRTSTGTPARAPPSAAPTTRAARRPRRP